MSRITFQSKLNDTKLYMRSHFQLYLEFHLEKFVQSAFKNIMLLAIVKCNYYNATQ